jgi:hypothetical protein
MSLRKITPIIMLMTLIVAMSCGVNDYSPDCDIQKGPCRGVLEGADVILDILPRPVVAMKELTFRVQVREDKDLPEKIIIDLSMPGMEMGVNRVIMKKTGEGVYEGKGIIVRCPSGRRLWKATLLFSPEREVSFTFNVIY